MENLIYEVFDALDDSEVNSNKYGEMFDAMSDAQFDSFFKTLFKDEDAYLTLDVVDYERTLKMENIEKAAKILDIPLFEKVIMPHVNMDTKNPVISKYEVPVGCESGSL